MEKLVQGIHYFQTRVFGDRRELFERLATEQEPQTLFITCADSRIVPNLITQTEPGELFLLRNAGNIIPAYGAAVGGTSATVEFAISGLEVHDIIVCGHTSCGAVDALFHPEKIAGMPAMAAWLKHAEATRRIVLENYTHLEGPARILAAIEENVLVQLENLRTHPAVAVRLNRGDLRLHAWVYRIDTGDVFAFDAEGSQFVPVHEVRNAAVKAGRVVREF